MSGSRYCRRSTSRPQRSVADWLHRVVGGLAPIEPGYKRISIQPWPGGGITYASARHLTPYGMAECSWRLEEEKINIEVVVPPNTTALVTLPGKDGEPVDVPSGTHRWSYLHREPDARPSLSMDSTVGDIRDDPETWSVVIQTLKRLIPQNVFLETMVKSQTERSLREALTILSVHEEVFTALDDVFATLGRQVKNR